MNEIFPGVFHWSAFHQPIRMHVSSYYVQPAGVVIDPKLPDEGFDAVPGRPEQVVLTTGLHDRDAQRFADEYGIPIRASQQAIERLDGALTGVEPWADREEVAPGVTALVVGKLCPDEGALHVAAGDGALAFADGVHSYGGALAFFSDDLLGDDPERVKAGLKDAYRGLLTLEFDHLLFAHGEPVVGGGKSALTDFLGQSG